MGFSFPHAAEPHTAAPNAMTTPTFCDAFAAIHLFAASAGAAVVDATYNNPAAVPVTAAS